eukprot:CAMPEP_0206519804 /NCGR_PEP_ID=MMETSP0324_2-20121206/65413_1 /ASSEMBLY_ACC=CAM_ASM_000836 /TAXON_ID=2866 /ORGANISM="Crypthecodinium cohnii, Strain Seligo" /LENGTH=152 /DNA_ID=CAMNT_0054013463 /DNA_START=174 /DNA_END=632 /DNA_ORIENTATION=-
MVRGTFAEARRMRTAPTLPAAEAKEGEGDAKGGKVSMPEVKPFASHDSSCVVSRGVPNASEEPGTARPPISLISELVQKYSSANFLISSSHLVIVDIPPVPYERMAEACHVCSNLMCPSSYEPAMNQGKSFLRIVRAFVLSQDLIQGRGNLT